MSKSIKVTPKGKANYPWVNRPDTTFVDEGMYQCNLILSKKAAAKMVKEIKELHKEAQVMFKKENKKGKKAKLPFFENDDGDIEFKFTQRAKIKSKKTGEIFDKTIPIFNSKNKPITPNLGAGSIIKISYEPSQYYHATQGAGVTLRLKAVQVLELVEWEQDYGFEEEEGYEGDDDNVVEEEEDDYEEEADSDEDEDGEEDPEDSGEEEDEDIPF